MLRARPVASLGPLGEHRPGSGGTFVIEPQHSYFFILVALGYSAARSIRSTVANISASPLAGPDIRRRLIRDGYVLSVNLDTNCPANPVS
jgi:hypothetical protein